MLIVCIDATTQLTLAEMYAELLQDIVDFRVDMPFVSEYCEADMNSREKSEA